MYRSYQELVQTEKYLRLNKQSQLVIEFSNHLKIIDFHIHLSDLLAGKRKDPISKGEKLAYPTLPPIEQMDLSQPYWTHSSHNHYKGISGILKFSAHGLRILNDMVDGGTFDNCFETMEANHIQKAVMLPISSAKDDRSPAALQAAARYPDRLVAFCSVHPNDPKRKGKIQKYKDMGAKGFKLKIPDMELKHDTGPLVELMHECHEARLPVLFHVGSNVQEDDPNVSKTMRRLLRCTRTEIYGDLLTQLPSDFTFVFGHSGIGEYKLVAEYLKKYPAAYAEISAQSADSIKYLIDEVGSDRLLFGTDWPALPQALTLSRVLIATEDDQTARDNILYKNAERLLHIQIEQQK